MLSKYLVPAAAVLALASAQTSTNVCSFTATTLTSQADATALASQCTAVTGTISISPQATGSIALDGIDQITGDLVCKKATKLISLSGSTLTTIGGTLDLEELTIMQTLGFPNINSIGAINWITLNALQFLTFTSLTKCKDITISDTQLNNLDGIDVTTVDTLDINNNRYLTSWQSSIGNITSAFSMAANAAGLSLTFPDLTWAANFTVRDVANISLPALAVVNGSLGFYEGTMTHIMLPNLTSIGSPNGGDLSVVADSALTNFSTPRLTTVNGGILVANNSELLSIDGFKALTTTKSISFSGNFSQATLPSLKTDSGALYVVSSGNFSCDQFEGYAPTSKGGNGVVRGSVTCTSGSTNVQDGGVSGTATSASGGGSSAATSKAAANGLTVDMSNAFGAVMFVSLFTVIGGLAGFAQLAL